MRSNPPTKIRVIPLGLGSLGLLICGCALPRSPSRALHSPVAAVEAPEPVTAAPPAPLESVPEAVYRNPKIGRITLRAHQDPQGRLLGPQVMYQIVDPGGWNLEALDPSSGAFVASGEEPPPAGTPLLDPGRAADTVITGLMRLEDRAAAETLAQKSAGRAAFFDEEAGWLLVPIPEKERSVPAESDR